jgi:hypothetical protein
LCVFLFEQDFSLYFTKPEQLLDIFTDMEDKSLPLLEKSQHAFEVLDQLQSNIDTITIDQRYQVESCQGNINQLKQSIEQSVEFERSCQKILK